MTAGPPPNYYKILEISEHATTQQIRDAYKRAALKYHPDRIAPNSPDRADRTRRFQLVNDAYYTLSDASRRREYDAQRRMYGMSGGGHSTRSGHSYHDADPFEEADEEIPVGGDRPANGSGFDWAWNFFTGQSGGQNTQEARQEAEDRQFGDVFEEMLREEGMAGDGQEQKKGGGNMWGIAGGLSGGILGFIVANFPGMMAGAVAGNRLGAIRDAKGKSVYEVFQTLPQSERAQLLTQLAAKVFSHAVGTS